MTRRPTSTTGYAGGLGAASGAASVTDPAMVAQWRARVDALTRWCLVDLPLTPAAARAAGALRPTLGDLLRRALGRAGDGVVDLLDALDAPGDLAARARLTRVLGEDVLLVVVTARDSAIVRADTRACRTPDEATALLSAFLGRTAPPWAVGGGVWVRSTDVVPLLARALDGGELPAGSASDAGLADAAADSIFVLPLLALDGSVPVAPPAVARFGLPAAANAPPNTVLNTVPNTVPDDAPDPAPNSPPAAGAPLVFGGVLRPGAAFLDAPGVEETQDAEDARDAVDDDADDAEPGTPSTEDTFLGAFTVGSPLGGGTGAFLPLAEEEEDAADEAAPVASDPSAALERLRARTAPAERVPVVVASDDGEAEHVGDAAAWLAEASEQELRALARGGWSGDTAVELALASDDPEIDDVARQARRHDAELVVEIDGDAAAAWLRRHRPETAERLAGVL